MRLSYILLLSLFAIVAFSLTVSAGTITLRPDGDDSTQLYTSGSSNNYANVDDDTNGDFDYNYNDDADTIKEDKYYCQEPSSTPGAITSVEVKIYAKYVGSGDAYGALILYDGSSYWEENIDGTISTSYAYYSHSWDSNPSGGDWEWSDFTDVRAGVELYPVSGELRVSSLMVIIHYSEAVEFSNHQPSNNSVTSSTSINWSIDMTNPARYGIDWNMTCSNGQYESATDDSDGRKHIQLTGLNESTTYTVWVNATNGALWTREIYYFTTPTYIYRSSSFGASVTVEPPTDEPPEITSPSPTNQSTNIPIDQSQVSINISDEMSNFNYTIEGEYINNVAENDVSDGTQTANLQTPLPYNTVIHWQVNATDGANWTRKSYYFITTQEPGELSLDVPNSYDFGYIDFDQENTSSTMSITNDGNQDITSVKVKTDDLIDELGLDTWRLGGTPGINVYSLRYYNSDSATWRTLGPTYTNIYTLNADQSKDFKIRIYTPTDSSYSSTNYGTLYFQYTNGTETTETTMDFTVSSSNITTNETTNQTINVSNQHFIKGGIFSSNIYYIPVNSTFTTNTTIALPNSYTGTSWGFFTSTEQINSILIYAVSPNWEFVNIPYDGTIKEFTLTVSDPQFYFAYIVVPNPGYFQESSTWFNWLNDAKDLFMTGESLI